MESKPGRHAASKAPYRHPAPGVDPQPTTAARDFDGDLLPALVGLWGVSVVLVALAVTRHEVFGAEATIAVLLVLLLSLQLGASFVRR